MILDSKESCAGDEGKSASSPSSERTWAVAGAYVDDEYDDDDEDPLLNLESRLANGPDEDPASGVLSTGCHSRFGLILFWLFH